MLGSRGLLISLALICQCIFTASVAVAQSAQTARDSLFEQEVESRLAERNSSAVIPFREAREAYDDGQYELAKEKYQEVLELVPNFSDAERRLSYVLLELGDDSAAIAHAEHALETDSSAYNLLALASAYLRTEDSLKYDLALDYAIVGADSLPDEAFAQQVLLFAGLTSEDEEVVKRASSRLVKVAPDFAFGHYFMGISHARDEDWEAAEAELSKSRDLGMDPAAVEDILAQGVRSGARIDRWKRDGLYVLAVWLVVLAVLFLLGSLLSTVTLRAVARTQSSGEYKVGQTEGVVRRIYRVLIVIASTFYYLSIPILLVIVVVVAGGFIYFWLRVGRIPIRLTLFVIFGAAVTLYAILRSLIATSRTQDPGRRLTDKEASKLRDVTDEVADTVQTRAIQEIFLTPGTEMAVMERGGTWQKLRGNGERCLIIGLAALEGLKLDWFKSILAHEYGHFSNKDTAGGNMAHQTSRSMHQMAMTLASNGLAKWYNPAWWFLRGFNAAFLRITLGASRLQEILADRISASAYGSGNFIKGLTHVIRRQLTFDMQMKSAFDQGVENFLALDNLYQLPSVESGEAEKELEEKLSEAINRDPSPYDSHPSPKERFELVERIESDKPGGESGEDVRQLLSSEELLEKDMTETVMARIRGARQAMAEAE